MQNLLRPAGSTAPLIRASQRRTAFALLVAAYFTTIVDFTIVNVALPAIGHALRFPESDLQWVVTAYGLTYAGFVLLGGRAADLLGRRRVLMVGVAVFTAASLTCGLATSDTFLIVARAMQGLGAALVLPAALSTVTAMYPEGAGRNKALGIWGGVGGLGGTVGLLAGGVLTSYVGWQFVFFFNVPIGVVALALIPSVVPDGRGGSGPRRYDVPGAVSVTAALLMLVYAVTQAPQTGWAAPWTVALLAAGTALLAAFFLIEAKSAAPLLPLPLFRLRSVAGSNAVGFLFGASWTTFVFLGTLYMQQVLGLSALAAGAAWTTASAISFTVSFTGLSQRAVTRTSPKWVMTFGMALIGISIGWAAQAPASGNFWHDLAMPFLIGGIGTSFAVVPISIGALAGVTNRDAGVASGLLSTSQNLGAAIGVAVTSSIATGHSHTLAQQGYQAAAALAGGLQWATWACGLAALAAIPAASLLIRRTRRTDAITITRADEPATAATR